MAAEYWTFTEVAEHLRDVLTQRVMVGASELPIQTGYFNDQARRIGNIFDGIERRPSSADFIVFSGQHIPDDPDLRDAYNRALDIAILVESTLSLRAVRRYELAGARRYQEALMPAPIVLFSDHSSQNRRGSQSAPPAIPLIHSPRQLKSLLESTCCFALCRISSARRARQGCKGAKGTAGCQGRHICPEFRASLGGGESVSCRSGDAEGLVHRRGDDEVVHVRPDCYFEYAQPNGKCTATDCKWGHDYPEVRRRKKEEGAQHFATKTETTFAR